MIRVAIADDSPFTCKLLASYIEAGGDCRVVGMAHDARSTIDLIRGQLPDVLTLDLQMPGNDGLALLKEVTSQPSTAVVVISGVTRLAAATTLRALELGAVDFILKYTPGAPVSRASLRREIISKVKIAAAVRHRATAPASAFAKATADKPAAARTVARPPAAITAPLPPRPFVKAAPRTTAGVVIIGASTGGPRAIGSVLAGLPPDFATPCIVVQHLPATFTHPFAEQLARHTPLRVAVAEIGMAAEPGLILIAPGSMHLTVRSDGRIHLQAPSPKDVYRPSINMAMTSAAEAFGPGAVGVVLTGSGDDGSDGLKRIRDAGGEGYVQEPSSCIVASMAERAIESAGADHVAPPDRIGQLLAVRKKP
jgi:two-component system, chemotaxis family, protein-glutamate methylesterase/glutaminase